jgi:hypothetical protein
VWCSVSAGQEGFDPRGHEFGLVVEHQVARLGQDLDLAAGNGVARAPGGGWGAADGAVLAAEEQQRGRLDASELPARDVQTRARQWPAIRSISWLTRLP